MSLKLLDVALKTGEHVAAARQRARQLADVCGLDTQDQVRFATAVSEIARNAVSHGGGGRASFVIETDGDSQSLAAVIRDQGPGIANLDAVLEGRLGTDGGMGIASARRLMDGFRIASQPATGTEVWFAKLIPSRQPIDQKRAAAIVAALKRAQPPDPLEDADQQNRALMSSLAELHARQEDLHRVNAELEATNRGVVALYGELDQRAEELRRASELKSSFLSDLSHELRTPLNSILALARLLLDQTDGPLGAEQQRQVGYIRQSAEILADLVNDLLDLAKVEAGKVELRSALFAVTDLFAALRGVLKPLQSSPLVELLFDEPVSPLTLVTDEGKVSQILRNLVSNALKFTETGEVRVAVEPVGTEFCRFTVRDTGIGIAAEDQERIFLEFTQVQHRLQLRSRGTGLGLPLSRRLATLLGGSLIVQSSPGLGSVFTLTLPVNLPGPADKPETTFASLRRRVLVIDDEETFRYVLRQTLTGLPDMEVAEAENGQLGLDRATAAPPDLVFLDLRMPGLDGFEVLRQLKSTPATAAVPVVICTSSLLDEPDRRRLDRAAAVLSKDALSRDSVSAALRSIFGAATAGEA